MKDIFTLSILGISFGFSFSVIKVLAGYPDIEMMAICGSTLVALILISTFKRKDIRVKKLLTKNKAKFFLVCGVSSFLFPLSLEFMVLETLDIGLVSIVVSTAPIFGVMFFLMSGAQRVNPRVVISVLIGLLACLLALYSKGALTSIFSDSVTSGDDFSVSLPLLVAIPVSYGFYHFYVDVKWPKGLQPNELAVGELFICSLLSLVVVMLHGFNLEPVDLTWVMMTGLLGCLTAIEALLYFNLQAKKGAIFCSFSDYIATITGVILGAVLFDESTSALVILALALVILAAWFANSHSHRQPTSEDMVDPEVV